jgi:hypothetical protein
VLLQETPPPFMFDNEALQVPVTSVEPGPVPLSPPHARTPRRAIENLRKDRSLNPGIEVQFDMRDPSWSHSHLVNLAPDQDSRRRIGRHGVGTRGQVDQKMASWVALEASHDPFSLPHLEAGAEWRITGVINPADGTGGAAANGSFEAGLG